MSDNLIALLFVPLFGLWLWMTIKDKVFHTAQWGNYDRLDSPVQYGCGILFILGGMASLLWIAFT